MKLKIIQKEAVTDAEGNAGTLYLTEQIEGIRKAVLKNGSFRPEATGKSRAQSFLGGYIEASEKMLENIKDNLREENIYETIERMKRGTFDIVYFPS